MSGKDRFKISYEVDDGYAGGSRPLTFCVRASDFFEEEMTDEQLRDLLYEIVEDDMRQRVSFVIRNADDFLEWARASFAESNKESAR